MIKRILLTISVLFYAISLFAQTYVRDAEQGSANAQYRLGRMYERADRMPKDISKAVYWYKKAAEQNHPQAIMALGELYYYGVEVKQKVSIDFYVVFDNDLRVTGAQASLQNLQNEFLLDKHYQLYFQNHKQFE